MTNVLLISVFPSSRIGGVSSHSSALKEGLERSGWAVRRVDLGEVSISRSLDSLNTNLRFSFSAVRELLRYKRGGGKIVHFHSSKRALPFRLLAPLLDRLGFAIILSLHSGIGYSDYLAARPRELRRMGRALRHAQRLVFMNERDAREASELLSDHADRIASIHPFIKPPPSRLPPLDQALTGEPFIVTVAGLWAPLYHYEEAILAAYRFQERRAIAVVVRVIAGTSALDLAYRARVVELLAELASANGAFAYTIEEDCTTVLAELATSSVLIRPTRADSYGLVLAEALLVGTPAIATDICRRVAGTILYAPGDTDRLDAELDRVYAERPRERVSLLPEGEDALASYIKLYEEVLKTET